MMGIIIALSIRTRSYRYWTRLSRISHDLTLKLHMTQYYALKIPGPGSWYSNVYVGTIRYGGFTMRGFRIATEEDLVVRERFPSSTERPSVR